MPFHLSRQRDYKDGGLYIDICVAGSKGANKDILTPRYYGELKNLLSPIDALNLAEEIHKQWDRDYGDEKKKLRIVGGSTDKALCFDFSTKGLASARKWADKVFSEMKKCGHCNKAMGSRDPYEIDDIPNAVFCTEVCCSIKYRNMFGVEAPKINQKGSKIKTLTKKP